MSQAAVSGHSGLLNQLLSRAVNLRANLTEEGLIRLSVERGEGFLTSAGALVVSTGSHTGRSPKDRYLVRDGKTESTVDWGAVNQPLSTEQYDRLERRVLDYFNGREAFSQELSAGADERNRLRVQVITAQPWHSLFARQLFLAPSEGNHDNGLGEFLVLQAPEVRAIAEEDGTRSATFIVVNFARRTVLIGGTAYAGEIKKSIFSVMNYLLPERGVFPMHCSANQGGESDVALFFGLSGTGKTTLSADPERLLIGDDEHGWSDHGIFNIEGGCYAKVIRLSREHEPQIWKAIHHYAAVLENVTYDPETKELDFDDESVTENTRAAYNIDAIDNAIIPGIAGHPRHILFLTCDAFGVLPPIARLDPAQAMYHFLSGYTAKVAGTEAGISDPQVTFSSCFGAPFLPRPPREYAAMLGEKMRRHSVSCWLVNTGWTGGPFGEGHRMPLPATRALVKAAVSGDLSDANFHPHPIFQVHVPDGCPGVDSALLDPRSTWADPARYDRVARELAARFEKNIEKFDVPAEIREAGPKAG